MSTQETFYNCDRVRREADRQGWPWQKWFTENEIRQLLPDITDRNLDRLDHDNDSRYCEDPNEEYRRRR